MHVSDELIEWVTTNYTDVNDMMALLPYLEESADPVYSRTLERYENGNPMKKKMGDRLLSLAKSSHPPDRKVAEAILEELCDERNHTNGSFDLTKVDVQKLATERWGVAAYAVLRGLAKLDYNSRVKAIEAVALMLPKHWTVSIAAQGKNLATWAGTKGAKTIAVALVAAQLAWDLLCTINDYYHGRISGKVAMARMTTAVGGVACGLAGAAAGFTVAGPLGAVVGGVVGTAAGEYVIKEAIDWLFNLHPDQAVQTAYDYLDMSKLSSTSEINSAYRKRAAKCSADRFPHDQHPEKKAEWLKLQKCVHLIRLDKGMA